MTPHFAYQQPGSGTLNNRGGLTMCTCPGVLQAPEPVKLRCLLVEPNTSVPLVSVGPLSVLSADLSPQPGDARPSVGQA